MINDLLILLSFHFQSGNQPKVISYVQLLDTLLQKFARSFSISRLLKVIITSIYCHLPEVKSITEVWVTYAIEQIELQTDITDIRGNQE